jgi:3-oxoacyl-[acyl-carrier protein] reductase
MKKDEEGRKIKPEEFYPLQDLIFKRAKEKMEEGYKKYGEELVVDPDKQVIEELADSINYQIIGLIPTQKIKRRILISGGTRGIGKALAEVLKERGHEVITFGSEECDLRHSEQILSYTSILPGKFDILVNNAAIFLNKPIENCSNIEISKILYVNLASPIYLIINLLNKDKIKKGGFILNISTLDTPTPFMKTTLYYTSKKALEAFSDSLKVELYDRFIDVEKIRLGVVKTDMLDENLPGATDAQTPRGAALEIIDYIKKFRRI